MGWSDHPDAEDPPERPHGLVPDGRVVALGAICDRHNPPPRHVQRGGQSFSVSEFVRLEDGRRVLLHQERGWTESPLIRTDGAPVDLDHRDSTESVLESVLTVVLPDGDAALIEPHPWEWLAELAQARGLSVTADQLKELPYEVVLSDDLKRWIAGD